MMYLKRLEQCEKQISFRKEPINESMMVAAEKLLVECIDLKSSTSFDVDIGKSFKTIYSFTRSFSQTHLVKCLSSWNPVSRTFRLWSCANRSFFFNLIYTQELSDDFLLPCLCLKCARDNICSCRKTAFHVVSFAKCQREDTCKNPENDKPLNPWLVIVPWQNVGKVTVAER